jgi:hypothetical protein
VRNLAQRVGAGRADTIAPVAELATKAPRGEARGTLGPGPGGRLGTISSVRHPLGRSGRCPYARRARAPVSVFRRVRRHSVASSH